MRKESEEARNRVVTEYDARRLEAIRIYCREKGADLNEAMRDTLDLLYARHVPPSVQKFLALQGGGETSGTDAEGGADS